MAAGIWSPSQRTPSARASANEIAASATTAARRPRCMMSWPPPRRAPALHAGESGSSRGGSERARVQDVFLEHLLAAIDLDQRDVVGPQISQMLQHAIRVGLVELRALDHGVAQHQAAIAGEIDIDHLDIGVEETDIVLA